MPHIAANGLTLCYDRFTPADGPTPDTPPLILIRGLGTQMIQWPARFIDTFVAAGREVIIFDNRDVGESQKLDAAGVPDIMALLAGADAGAAFPVPYTIADMAADVVGLMDALDIEKADVFGMSLGGMVAQHLAFSHGDRMAHVICVMSSSGNPQLPRPAVSSWHRRMMTTAMRWSAIWRSLWANMRARLFRPRRRRAALWPNGSSTAAGIRKGWCGRWRRRLPTATAAPGSRASACRSWSFTAMPIR